MHGVYIMDGGGGGGGGARGGGSITRGGKLALVTRDGSSIRDSRGLLAVIVVSAEPDSGSGTHGGSATRGGISACGGSGTYGTYVQEFDSGSAAHATFERQGSKDSSYKCKGKKTVEERKRQTFGKYTILRGGKTVGLAGSHSRMGRGDEMTDLDGVLRNIRIHDIYGYGGKDDGGNRPWIKRCGKKFANGRVHKSVIGILDQKLDGIWPMFSMIPHSKLKEMFNTFRTRWRWDPRDEQHIYDGFLNVLAGRYRDKWARLRLESKKKARADGYVIGDKEMKFDITQNYPHAMVPLERWKHLCDIWDTEKWSHRSQAGRNNRKNDLSRHTGGSMGFDEHRIRLEKQKGGKVGYDLVFVDTHATKETKKRLRDEEINIKDLEELEFVTQRSKKSFASFQKELEKEYGSTNDQNPNRGDLAVWERLNPNSRGNMFGIGSSDPNFVVNWIQSSFYGCGSYNDVGKSQKVHDVCLELEREHEARENLENHLEQLEIDREEEREQAHVEREKERAEREKLQKQIIEILKRFGNYSKFCLFVLDSFVFWINY
ncbi:hypothetical protein QVD17_29303 [Tagetes erecta]|uniref:Transposase n=1 Tax=Tagetes erecta TaxID=13708 RepID=A0AAD8NSZ1_TARER|nr:hypothetical protein QVD17_29303 [Tagetes erecta]